MLKKEEKKLCADRLVEMIEDDLKDFGYGDLIEIFRTSETFEQLYNFKTRLWSRGPDYILGRFAEEKGVKIEFLEEDWYV